MGILINTDRRFKLHANLEESLKKERNMESESLRRQILTLTEAHTVGIGKITPDRATVLKIMAMEGFTRVCSIKTQKEELGG
jgi:hypothetical protein